MLKILIVAAAAMLAGCSTYSTGRYTSSTDNVMALRASGAKAVNVGAFTAPDPEMNKVWCTGTQPLTTSDGQPFAEFVRKALVDEMRMAGTYSLSAPVTISGVLKVVGLTDSPGSHWDLAVTFSSSNGKSVAIAEAYPFPWSFGQQAVCTSAAQAFVPAVQDLLGKFVASPQFALLTTP